MIQDSDIAEAVAEVLAQVGEVDVVFYGRSMVPTIWPGARVRVESYKDRGPLRGDVVVAKRAGMLVAHRLVGGGPGGWVLQGDAYIRPDEPARDQEILGRITALQIRGYWLPVDSSPARWLARHLVPLLRAAHPPTKAVARSLYRWCLDSRSLRGLRLRLQPVKIRRLERHDAERVRRACHRRGIRFQDPGWAFALEDPDSFPFAMGAINRHGRLIGWARVNTVEGEAGIFDLYVTHTHRGLGVSNALISEVAAQLANHTLFADVRRERGAAYRAFLGRGFVELPDHPSASPDHLRLVRRPR